MSTQICVAVIGAGGLIGQRHCQHVLQCTETSLVAIVDPSSSGKQLSETLAVPWFADIDALLAASLRLDAAIVCTPNHTHVQLSIVLLQAGIHVLCEKPISNDIRTAHELVEVASHCRAHLLIGHHRRFNPYVVRTLDIIKAHELGNIIAFSGLWTAPKPLDYFADTGSWRQDRDQGGVVLINLIHDVEILQSWFGPIQRVHAEKSLSTRSNDTQTAEEGAVLTLKFESRIVGTFVVNDNVASSHNFEMGTGENPHIPLMNSDCYRIFGTEGTLSFPDMLVTKYIGNATWNRKPVIEKVKVKDDESVPLADQLMHFVNVCREQETPRCTAQDALRALLVCHGIRGALYSPSGGGTIEF